MTRLEEFLKRNRELAEAATPGEWWVDAGLKYTETEKGTQFQHVLGAKGAGICSTSHYDEIRVNGELFAEQRHGKLADAQFIAASRTSLPLALEMLSMTVEWITARRDAAFANMEGTGGTEFQQWSELWGISENILAALEEKAGRG